MTILAVEFSSVHRSVAIGRDGAVLAEAVETGGGRTTRAFGLIEKVLADAKIARDEVGGIAIGLGPGSYTGIRSAIALAQGWQLAKNLPLTGISSVESIAAIAQARNISGTVHIVIDAQRGELYHAAYAISATERKEIEPLKIVSPSAIDATGTVIGPDIAKWFPSAAVIFPSAAAVLQLAFKQSNAATLEPLEPIYLRETAFVKAPPPRLVG